MGFHEEQRVSNRQMKLQIAFLPALFTLLLIWQVVLKLPTGGKFLSNHEVIGWTILLWLIWLRLTHVRLVTNLFPDKLRVTLRGVFRSCTIPIEQIVNTEVVNFDPVKEYGGFGIRTLGKGRVCLAAGNRGVMIQLKAGTFVLVGSQTPEALRDALATALKKKRGGP